MSTIHAAEFLARFGLALLFLLAGTGKLLNLLQFTKVVSSFDIVPLKYAKQVAAVVVSLEILSGIGFFFRSYSVHAAVVSIILLSLFCGALRPDMG